MTVLKNYISSDSYHKYIYESPDGGKTIYRRKFLDYDNRELVIKRTDTNNNKTDINKTDINNARL